MPAPYRAACARQQGYGKRAAQAAADETTDGERGKKENGVRWLSIPDPGPEPHTRLGYNFGSVPKLGLNGFCCLPPLAREKLFTSGSDNGIDRLILSLHTPFHRLFVSSQSRKKRLHLNNTTPLRMAQTAPRPLANSVPPIFLKITLR